MTNLRINRDQLVKLELIYAREESGNVQLRALLTLQFGGFESGEYVTYHYENVVFNVLTGVIAFNQTDQEVYLSNVVLRNGKLTGDVSSSTGYIGSLKLSSKSTERPVNPLVEPLGGEYTGVCKSARKDQVAALQLFTFRSTLDTTRLGNPFGAYEAKGVVGVATPGYCSPKKTTTCTYSKIKSVSYNFYDGDLTLSGQPFSYRCKAEGGLINCGECSFRRVSNEMRAPQMELEVHDQDPIDAISSKLKMTEDRSLRGSYDGYIFHEARNVFQKVRLDVTTFERRSERGSDLMVAVVASVNFGDNPNENIAYKFDSTPILNPLITTQLILARPQDDVDPVVKINEIKGGVIRGVWNSNIFGRVGSFIATRNGDLPRLKSDLIMKGIGSGYEELNGERFIADLIISKGNAPIGSDNPYYPLVFSGYVWNRRQIILKEGITGGSYDFYSGKIAVLFGAEKTLSGFIQKNEEASWRRLGGGFGTLLQKFTPATFRKTNNLPK